MTSFSENSTSYFSTPAPSLDPALFEGRVLRPQVRQGIMHLLSDFFNRNFRHSELWAHPWLAGSGVSYQWSSDRTPKDLDCLVGVDFVQFRKANPSFHGLLDTEIAAQINDQFREELQPQTENWNGFELTFYVNPSATDIRSIKPYAAYDLKYDEWTVTPNPYQEAERHPEWDSVVDADYAQAHLAHTRATKALQDLSISHAGPQRRNSEVALHAAFQQAEAIYNTIHENRSLAFSSTGEGYSDFNNYRWQSAKRTGAIDLLKNIQQAAKQHIHQDTEALYGVDLPDASTLIRRAALYRNK